MEIQARIMPRFCEIWQKEKTLPGAASKAKERDERHRATRRVRALNSLSFCQ